MEWNEMRWTSHKWQRERMRVAQESERASEETNELVVGINEHFWT